MTESPRTTQFSIEESLEQACHLVANDDDITAVYLICPSRPTFQDIHSGCEFARDQHVQLTIDERGALIIRSRAESQPDCTRTLSFHPRLANMTFGFAGLDEGVR